MTSTSNLGSFRADELTPRRGSRPTTLVADLIQLWPVLADRKATFAGMVGVGLAGAILEACAVSLVSLLIYHLLGASTQAHPFSALDKLSPIDLGGFNLWVVFVIVVAAVLARTAAFGAYAVLAASLKNLVFHRLRVRLFQYFMFAPFQDMTRASFGYLTNALQVEAPRAAELIDQLFRVPINLCGALVFFAVLVVLSWPVAVLAAVAGLLLAVIIQFSRVYLHRFGQRLLALNEQLASRMLAGMQALKTIRAFGAEEREFDRFAQASRAVAGMAVRFAAVESTVMPSASLAALAMIAIVVVFSSMLANEAATTLTIVALLFRMQPQLQGLQSSVTSIHALESSLALIVQIIKQDVPPRRTRSSVVEPPALRHMIRFRDVSYSHPTCAEPTLRQVNFEIPRGLVTAIVGESGAGKTTLLNLILKLTEPTTGSIEVDELPFASIDRLSWLRRVAVAGQDVELLNGTVLENLSLGCPDLSPEAATNALEIAGIADFVSSLPEGLDTRLGERGQLLSGGQRQRIALARAIVMQPQLLILDEATNSVDSVLEAAIYQRLRAMFPNLTMLIVAHRSSALSEADLIVTLVDGQVRSVRRLRQLAAG